MSRPGRRAAGEAEASAARAFATHVARPGDVRSFYLQRACGSRNHSCNLTWTPDALTLSGDAGDVMIQHYRSGRTCEQTLRWVEASSASYLVGKSGLNERVLDRDGTVDYLVEEANRSAGESLASYRDEYRAARRAERYGSSQWALDMEWWNATRDGPPPRVYDYLPEPDWRENRPEFRYRSELSGPLYEAPDGWELWYELYESFGSDCEPCELLRAECRIDIRAQFRAEIQDMSPDEVAELCNELGHSDYYGCYVTDPDSVYRVAMVQQACRVVLDSLDPRRTWGRTWSDPVV